ncbi:hypothetical protein WOSG25_012550 [Weissella oryzae SG25]|uniref:LXG domain-containing protein n=1 Tax=Weissella oryzae (strain DSM 25784 / JCM 18191 / LMG 30913 / SG25) TaxID=1329250 RepID=A0A069CSC0_WEIOS|nr:T7SS effector LXG polymorphic toxin [Weissella oryzae]GAK30158.1 hypothetical protein WOSG25_012550 [Weissella oryzae SG25]
MGFHINMKEISENLNHLQNSAKKQADAADKASKGFQNIVNTNAFEGATGEAVKNNAANVHVPLQKAIKDMDTILVQDYQQTILAFQSMVKETDENAILDEDILQDLSRDLEKLIDENNQISKKFAQIYHGVDDIVSLKNPSTTDFNHAIRESKKVLTDTIQSVHQFDAAGKASTVEEIANRAKMELAASKSVAGLAYSDAKLQATFKNNEFATEINQIDKQIIASEKAARKRAIEEQKRRRAQWGKRHPVTSWLEEKAAGIGNWWDKNIVKNTKDLKVPWLLGGVKGSMLELEGMIGAAGKLVSSVAIGASQALQASFEVAEIGITFAAGQKQRQWELDDQTGALNNFVAAGEHAISWLASNTEPLQIIRPVLPENMQNLLKTANKISSNDLKSVKNYFGDMANSVLKGDNYKIGGYVFDIGSLFVGAGELKVGLKGAELGEGAAKAEKIIEIGREHLSTAERFSTSDLIDYATGIDKLNIRQEDIDALVEFTTHNESADTTLLGKFKAKDVNSYEQIAYTNGMTYFDAGDDGWKAMEGIGDRVPFQVNHQFLVDQVNEGKNIILNDSPYIEFENYSVTGEETSYYKEITFLESNGYKIEEFDGHWKAVKQ